MYIAQKTMIQVNPTELYSQRVLIFMETEPQSNTYRQVILDAKKFKAMSDTISVETGRKLAENINEIEIELSDEEYVLPDLKEIYG